MKDEMCGLCKYHKYDQNSKEWVCTCPDSEFYGLETDYEYVCEEWEEKNR